MAFDFRFIWQYGNILASGLVVTAELSALVILMGTFLGIFLALAKKSSTPFLKSFSSVFNNFFRIMPILVMLVWVYYVFPIMFKIKIGAFETGLLVLSLHLSAFVSVLVSSGVEAVPKGQVEAAKTLGLTEWQINTKIILPQVFMLVFPPLIGLYIEEIKNTVLLSIIALDELLHVGQIIISQTYMPLEVYTSIGVIFFIILWPLTVIEKKFEHAEFIRKLEKGTR